MVVIYYFMDHRLL